MTDLKTSVIFTGGDIANKIELDDSFGAFKTTGERKMLLYMKAAI